MVQVNVGVIFLVLVNVLLTRGQNTCDRCISETEFMECVSREILPCSIVSIDFICVPDAPRDTLCQPPPPACTQEGKFLFPGLKDECDRYYECDSSLVATTKFCSDGQLFSELLQECVAPEDSECTSTSVVTTTTTNIAVSTSEPSSSSTEAPQSTTPLLTTTTPVPTSLVTTRPETTTLDTTIPIVSTTDVEVTNPISTTTPTVKPVECTKIGRLPDPTNCKRFYTCIWRPFREEYIKVLRTCPFRLMYDSHRRMCRFNTKCGDRPLFM